MAIPLQKAVLCLARNGTRLFRVNSGRAWQGSKIEFSADRSTALLINPRPILLAPTGTPDVVGCTAVTITQDMVGQTIGVFVGLEVKNKGDRPRPEQRTFIDVYRRMGARVGFVRSAEEAEHVLQGKKKPGQESVPGRN